MSIISHYITRRYLARENKKHLKEFPQVACFSFDLITTSIHLDGQYERDYLEFMTSKIFPNLPKSGACLDIGANIGNHALHFSRTFEQVIAFEPHPRIFRLLALNAELAPNIIAVNLGASSAPGKERVVENRQNLGATGVGRGGEGKSFIFELSRIDDIPEVQNVSNISFIKLDVEGHERQALEGARETILRHSPLIALEVLSAEISNSSSASLEFLRGLGYRYFYEPVSTGLLGRLPKAVRKTGRTLTALFTGRRPSKAARLALVDKLEQRSYQLVLCSTNPIVGA